MSSGELLLAIDCGTQSLRALVYDLRGEQQAKAQVPFEPYTSPQPGWAEQDPTVYWEALCTACQRLWAEEGVDREALAGVSLTTQRSTLVNLDEQGELLRPAIVWLDQRRTEGLPPVGGMWGLLLRLSGMRQTVASFQAECEANWIRTEQPEIWERTAHYLLLSGYLTHRLTGQYCDSVGCQVGYLPFEYKTLAWAGPKDFKWGMTGVAPEQLPALKNPGEQLGEISPACAEKSGIPAGLPVIAAAADKACEVLGAGALEPHVGCLSYGTTATINTTQRRYVEAIPFIPPFPSAVTGAWSLEHQIYRGFWMVSWFKRQFGHPERRRAAEQGVEPEALFDELVNAVPPGSMGLILQPYWSPGVKIPGPEAKGAVIGFGDVHKRSHLYRAILEGLAYGLREGKERMEKRAKCPITELRVAGGGSQSDAAMQITADIFGLPAARPHVFETSGLGAAMDLAVGLGLHPNFETAVADMTRLRDSFDPNPEAVAIYDGLYRRVYQKLYKRLKPLYEEIRDITGYPP